MILLRKFFSLTAIAIFTLNLNLLPSNIHFPISYGTRSYACQILPLASGDVNAFILKGWLFSPDGSQKAMGKLLIEKINSRDSKTETLTLLRRNVYLEMKPLLIILPQGNYSITVKLGKVLLRFYYP